MGHDALFKKCFESQAKTECITHIVSTTNTISTSAKDTGWKEKKKGELQRYYKQIPASEGPFSQIRIV